MFSMSDNHKRDGSLKDPWGDQEREAEKKRAEEAEEKTEKQPETPPAGPDEEEKFFSERVESFGMIVFRRFIRHRLAIIGFVVLLVLALMAIFAPFICKYSPTDVDLTLVTGGQPTGPNGDHWFGTDALGRDYFARIVYALRTAMLVGFSASAISFAVGVPLGFLSGWYGGKVDWIIQRGMELMGAIPTYFLMIFFSAVTGGGVLGTILVLGLTGKWTGYCRGIRAYFYSLKEQDFVQGARATGMGKWRLWVKHMLPYALAPEIVSLSGDIASNVAAEAGLSFLGFGVREPTPSLGAMLNVGRNYILTAPWMSIIPGLVVALIAFSCNFIGDGLRDAFDPKTQI